MKTMFVGGRLHGQVLEIPKGVQHYSTEVLIEGQVMRLDYQMVSHPQLFRIVAYNGKLVPNLPIDFYTTHKVRKWIELISKYQDTPSMKMKAQPKSI